MPLANKTRIQEVSVDAETDELGEADMRTSEMGGEGSPMKLGAGDSHWLSQFSREASAKKTAVSSKR